MIKKKTTILILITIFILSLLTLFFYQKSLRIYHPLPTTDWQSYQNQKYGFSYKLPTNFTEYQKSETYLSQYQSVNTFKTSDYQNPSPKNGYGLIVSVKENACDQVSNNKTSSFKYQLSTINNLKLQKYLLKGDSVYNWNALIDLKNSCLTLSLDVGSNNINNSSEQLFSQILTTLQFSP